MNDEICKQQVQFIKNTCMDLSKEIINQFYFNLQKEIFFKIFCLGTY